MAPAAPHPLDPLSPAEVAAAASACRAAHAARGGSALGRHTSLRFNTVTLLEPPKRDLLRFLRGPSAPPPRRAFCVLQAPPAFGVIEAVVDLSVFRDGGAAAVVSWDEVRRRDGGCHLPAPQVAAGGSRANCGRPPT